MHAGTLFTPDLLKYGHVVPNPAEQCRSSFESPGGSSAPSSVLIATPTPQTGSLSLVDEHTSASFMFFPVQFGDLAVSALVDSRAMHNFLAISLLPKLCDHPALCQLFLASYRLPWRMGVWFRQLSWPL